MSLKKTKLLIYKQIIHPEVTYGIQLWESTKNFNIQNLQSFQSISVRLLTGAFLGTLVMLHFTKTYTYQPSQY